MAEQPEVTVIMKVVAGGGGRDPIADGPALAASVCGVKDMTAGPDGTIYFCERQTHCIRILKDGRLSTVAGNGREGFRDGIARHAEFTRVQGVSAASDGTIYASDYSNQRIRAVKGGQVLTVAGNGEYKAKDGPALQGGVDFPTSIAVGPDDSLFIACWRNKKIRMLQNGQLSTIAGSGASPSLDGPAHEAQFSSIERLTVGQDGAVYIADAGAIRMLKNGHVTTLDNPANEHSYVSSMTVDAFGTVYFIRGGGIRTLKDGKVSVLLGSGGLKTDPPFPRLHPESMCIGNDGFLYIAYDRQILAVSIPGRPFVPVRFERSVVWNSSTFHLLKSSDHLPDLDIKTATKTAKLHRCLVQRRCPTILANLPSFEQKPIDDDALSAFVDVIYADKLSLHSLSPTACLSLAYLLHEAKLYGFAYDCLVRLQAAILNWNITADQLVELYGRALDFEPFEDGIKVVRYLLRKYKGFLAAKPLIALQRDQRALEILVQEFMDNANAKMPIIVDRKIYEQKQPAGSSLAAALETLMRSKEAADFEICIHVISSGFRESKEKLLNISGPEEPSGMHPTILQAIMEICYTGELSQETIQLIDLEVAGFIFETSELYLEGFGRGEPNIFEPLIRLATNVANNFVI